MERRGTERRDMGERAEELTKWKTAQSHDGDAKTRATALEVMNLGQGHTGGQVVDCELSGLRAGCTCGKGTEGLKA